MISILCPTCAARKLGASSLTYPAQRENVLVFTVHKSRGRKGKKATQTRVCQMGRMAREGGGRVDTRSRERKITVSRVVK